MISLLVMNYELLCSSYINLCEGGTEYDAGDKLVFETTADIHVISTFDSMGLKEDLLRGIYAYGFEKPSAIQQRAIIPIIKGRDTIAQSQSGT